MARRVIYLLRTRFGPPSKGGPKKKLHITRRRTKGRRRQEGRKDEEEGKKQEKATMTKEERDIEHLRTMTSRSIG